VIRPPRRWRRALLVGLAVLVVAAGAVAANLSLLAAAGEDRLGRLRPVEPELERPAAPVRTVPVPSRPDDDRGGGRGPGRGRDDD
jgi:hypothetical protein